MKQMLNVLAIAMTMLCGNVDALVPDTNSQNSEARAIQSNLYVVVLDIDEEGFITLPEYMSLEDYALLIEEHGVDEITQAYPRAAFALVRFDSETQKLFPTDPGQEIKHLQRNDPNWYEKEVRFSKIFKKTSHLFFKTCEVAFLWTCWTTSYVLIPGAKELYEHGYNLIKWLREHYSWQVEEIIQNEDQKELDNQLLNEVVE